MIYLIDNDIINLFCPFVFPFILISGSEIHHILTFVFIFFSVKYIDYFIPYPEKVSLLPGDKVIRGIDALDKCAAACRLEKNFTCRGFEYCRAKKVCSLHIKHILDLKPGETGVSTTKECIHYAGKETMFMSSMRKYHTV